MSDFWIGGPKSNLFFEFFLSNLESDFANDLPKFTCYFFSVNLKLTSLSQYFVVGPSNVMFEPSPFNTLCFFPRPFVKLSLTFLLVASGLLMPMFRFFIFQDRSCAKSLIFIAGLLSVSLIRTFPL